MRSPVYWHPAIYHLTMRMLYGKYFESRYKAIAELIPDNTRVIEVCAGDGYLYRNYLRKKNVKYLGLDINRSFVSYGKRNNIPFEKHDIMSDPLPVADYVIIQASLYQFIPMQGIIIRKLLDAAGIALLVAEPIRNLSSNGNPLISFVAKYSANPEKEHAVQRFNKETLLGFFRQFKEFKEVREMDGGREMIGVFKK